MILRAFFVALANVGLQPVRSECQSELLSLIEHIFNVSTPKDLVSALLISEQQKCAAGRCPTVSFAGCTNQSVDDVSCEIPKIADATVQIGTETTCDIGCDSWPCKASCEGIDVGICYTADYVLCKAGCLGISSCIDKCERAIVDPCKQRLIDDCKTKCESAFESCKESCKKELTMDISIDFERLQRALSSLSVVSVDLNCSGQAILNPMSFAAKTQVKIDNLAVTLKVHTADMGITSVDDLVLDQIRMDVAVPVNGTILCSIFKSEIDVFVGQASVSDVDLDVDLTLDKSLQTLANVICAGLPACKEAISAEIAEQIKATVLQRLPATLADQISSVLGGLAKSAHCPKALLATTGYNSEIEII